MSSGWRSRVIELAQEHGATIVVDSYGPLSAIVPTLEQANRVRVRSVAVGRVVDAAAGLVDLVNSGGIAHMPDPRLDDAVAGVTKRKIGDRWAFNRRGDVDVSVLVAASLAVWGVTTVRTPTPAIH